MLSRSQLVSVLWVGGILPLFCINLPEYSGPSGDAAEASDSDEEAAAAKEKKKKKKSKSRSLIGGWLRCIDPSLSCRFLLSMCSCMLPYGFEDQRTRATTVLHRR